MGTVKKKIIVHNPPKEYWFWRRDYTGTHEYNPNPSVYIKQTITPPKSLGKCNTKDGTPCQNSVACFNGQCLPYANSEIYNNPCCMNQAERLCNSWINKQKYDWSELLYMLVPKDKQYLFQHVKSNKEFKKIWCEQFNNICRDSNDSFIGPIKDEKLAGHCYLEMSAMPDPSQYNQLIRSTFHNNPYLYAKLECSVKITNLKNGSRGWGFWNTFGVPDKQSWAWFMQQDGVCPPNQELCPYKKPYFLNGFYAFIMTPYDKDKKYFTGYKLPDLDENWHDYVIDWKQDSVKFYIDGKVVASDSNIVPQRHMAFHFWVDNSVFGPTGIDHWVQDMKKPRSQEMSNFKITFDKSKN